jgi:hypothetical protein
MPEESEGVFLLFNRRNLQGKQALLRREMLKSAKCNKIFMHFRSKFPYDVGMDY